MLQVIIRADAALSLGTGHIMRCRTLANALRRELGADTLFVCRAFDGHLAGLLEQDGHAVTLLPASATPAAGSTDYREWLGASIDEDVSQTRAAITAFRQPGSTLLLITDHYGIDAHWQQQLRENVDQILAIDDLADRPLDCDLLLDTTYGRQPGDYQMHVPANARLLVGSRYALLRDEFNLSASTVRNERRQPHKRQRLLVMLGGSDPDNLTLTILHLLAGQDYQVTAVVGPTMPHWQSVAAWCDARPHYTFARAPDDIARLMLAHDMAIAAAGSTSWERCACGLPSLIVIQAENQLQVASAIAAAGAAKVLHLPLSATAIESGLALWRDDDEAWQAAVEACLAICDGNGTQRVVEAIRQKLASS